MTITTTLNKFPAPKTAAQCEQLWEAMKQAAADAHAEWQNPDSGITRYPGGLGSAWIKIPNRGSFAKWLLANDLGWLPSNGGVHVSTYVRNGFPQTGQSESASWHFHVAVARVLTDYGIKYETGSYSS